MGRSIWKSGGPKMHNPPPYVGINSADPPQITWPTPKVTTSLHRVVCPYLLLINYLSGFHILNMHT